MITAFLKNLTVFIRQNNKVEDNYKKIKKELPKEKPGYYRNSEYHKHSSRKNYNKYDNYDNFDNYHY